jgi:hypothetical protein
MKMTQTVVEALWPKIAKKGHYRTPDKKKGAAFDVIASTKDCLTVQTGRGASIIIQKKSFQATLDFLIKQTHTADDRRCEIRASKSNPGFLDLASRIPAHSKATMVIPYVLPILAATGVITIDSNRPNAVWLNV